MQLEVGKWHDDTLLTEQRRHDVMFPSPCPCLLRRPKPGLTESSVRSDGQFTWTEHQQGGGIISNRQDSLFGPSLCRTLSQGIYITWDVPSYTSVTGGACHVSPGVSMLVWAQPRVTVAHCVWPQQMSSCPAAPSLASCTHYLSIHKGPNMAEVKCLKQR